MYVQNIVLGTSENSQVNKILKEKTKQNRS